jgi:hypothetical protein
MRAGFRNSRKSAKGLSFTWVHSAIFWENTPAPTDIATCMYYTGIDPFTKEEVYIARGLRDRKMQRALMQFFQGGELVYGARGADHRRGGRI